MTSQKISVGSWVPLPLDVIEMGMPEDLQAEVLAIRPCPPVKPGPGRVVLTTVNHLNCYVRELLVEDSVGRREKIRPTGFHKFYRVNDGKWVSAEDLQPSDELQGQNGRLRVVANTGVASVHRVYNMTVEGEHVYRVSALGVLSHNIRPCKPNGGPQAVGKRRKGGKGGAEHTKGKRRSTKEKHEKGKGTKRRSKGGEKGDERRSYQR